MGVYSLIRDSELHGISVHPKQRFGASWAFGPFEAAIRISLFGGVLVDTASSSLIGTEVFGNAMKSLEWCPLSF